MGYSRMEKTLAVCGDRLPVNPCHPVQHWYKVGRAHPVKQWCNIRWGLSRIKDGRNSAIRILALG